MPKTSSKKSRPKVKKAKIVTKKVKVKANPQPAPELIEPKLAKTNLKKSELKEYRLLLLERRKEDEIAIRKKVDSGVLYSSGLIAGEGLIGILLAIFAIIPAGVTAAGDPRSLGDAIAFGNNALGQWGSLIFFALLCITLIRRSFWLKTDKE